VLRSGNQVISHKGLLYFLDEKGKRISYKPWLGDSVGFLYDLIMEKNIFPRKFGANIEKHYEILREMMTDIHGMKVLELATGSGSVVHFLAVDNNYTGSDISVSLLRQAKKKVEKAGFKDSKFYVTSSENSMFEQNSFQVCLCILAINFLNDLNQLALELAQILQPGGVFYCCVPVPERNNTGSIVRGNLYTERKLQEIFSKHNFGFEACTATNGSLLYFQAIRKN